MGLLEQIYEKAKENPQRIAFPEAVNEKMMQAAYETGKEGYIIPAGTVYAGIVSGGHAPLSKAEIIPSSFDPFLRKTVSQKCHSNQGSSQSLILAVAVIMSLVLRLIGNTNKQWT